MSAGPTRYGGLGSWVEWGGVKQGQQSRARGSVVDRRWQPPTSHWALLTRPTRHTRLRALCTFKLSAAAQRPGLRPRRSPPDAPRPRRTHRAPARTSNNVPPATFLPPRNPETPSTAQTRESLEPRHARERVGRSPTRFGGAVRQLAASRWTVWPRCSSWATRRLVCAASSRRLCQSAPRSRYGSSRLSRWYAITRMLCPTATCARPAPRRRLRRACWAAR